MLSDDPVKIPEQTKRINYMHKEGIMYVRYLTGRTYDPEKKYNIPNWMIIGRQIEAMPGLMIPNENYYRVFGEKGAETEEDMTAEEGQYVQDSEVYGTYNTFFTGLYNEFKQLTRRKADDRVNRYKADNINKVLAPLKELMKDEEYSELLGLIEADDDGENGMTYGDAMILLTQYKSALTKWHRSKL